MSRLPHQLLIIFCCLLFGVTSSSAQPKLPSQDPGHKHDAKIATVKFSMPKGFKLEPSPDPRVAFMRHQKYELALFVGVPETKVDDKYLIALSNTVASQLFPKERNFRWKVAPQKTAEDKVSDFQSSIGSTKGFNGKRFFQTHYITVALNNREILVGYITPFGGAIDDAMVLFEQKDTGLMSMPGWYAQAHILASLTGEKYERINPGAVIEAVPVNPN